MTSSATHASASVDLAALSEALREMADALAQPNLEQLLACETKLASALDGACGNGAMTVQAIEDARAALLRCRRLGASLVGFTRLTLDPDGLQTYLGLGGVAGVDPARSVEARG